MQRTAVTIFISGRGSTPRMHGLGGVGGDRGPARIRTLVNIDSHSQGHLACFAGGMLALGTLAAGMPTADRTLAEEITQQCHRFWMAAPCSMVQC